MKARVASFVRAGMEVSRGRDFSAKLAREEFTKNPKPFPTSTELRDARQRPVPLEAIELRQCNLGKLARLAAVSGPDICARLAQLAARVISLHGSDIYRIKDLVETVKEW